MKKLILLSLATLTPLSVTWSSNPQEPTTWDSIKEWGRSIPSFFSNIPGEVLVYAVEKGYPTVADKLLQLGTKPLQNDQGQESPYLLGLLLDKLRLRLNTLNEAKEPYVETAKVLCKHPQCSKGDLRVEAVNTGIIELINLFVTPENINDPVPSFYLNYNPNETLLTLAVKLSYYQESSTQSEQVLRTLLSKNPTTLPNIAIAVPYSNSMRNTPNAENPNIIDILIESGIPLEDAPTGLNEPNLYLRNNNALTLAIATNKNKIATRLIKKGFPLLRKNKNLPTPLHVALRFNNKECINLILAKAAEQKNIEQLLAARDERGFTPLHTAAADGYTDHVKTLLKKGSRTDLIDPNNATPLDVAAENGHEETANLLSKKTKKSYILQNSKPTYLKNYEEAQKELYSQQYAEER